MSRNALHLSALLMGFGMFAAQMSTGDHAYFITANIWLAASVVISCVNRR